MQTDNKPQFLSFRTFGSIRIEELLISSSLSNIPSISSIKRDIARVAREVRLKLQNYI